jgi:hypothetical protein
MSKIAPYIEKSWTEKDEDFPQVKSFSLKSLIFPLIQVFRN